MRIDGRAESKNRDNRPEGGLRASFAPTSPGGPRGRPCGTHLFLAVPASASAATTRLGTGQATFTLDPFFGAFFVENRFPFYPVAPATMKFSIATTPKVTMPITGGVWNKGFSRGQSY